MSDNFQARTYRAAMERGQPFIELMLDVSAPIEIGDFISAFTSVATEYDRYIRIAQPDVAADATLFVKQVRAGSVIAELVPWLPFLPNIVEGMSAALTVEDFVKRYARRLSPYFQPGGRLEDASKAELKDFLGQVSAIANHPGSRATLAAIEIKDGAREVRAILEFDTSQALVAQAQIEQHRVEMDHGSGADWSRVTMIFTRSDVRSAALGKRSGELVKIERVSDRSLPLIYASEMAEQAIKQHIAEAEDNVYKKGFVVDVNVESRSGKPIAFRITALHQVFDLPDEDD